MGGWTGPDPRGRREGPEERLRAAERGGGSGIPAPRSPACAPRTPSCLLPPPPPAAAMTVSAPQRPSAPLRAPAAGRPPEPAAPPGQPRPHSRWPEESPPEAGRPASPFQAGSPGGPGDLGTSRHRHPPPHLRDRPPTDSGGPCPPPSRSLSGDPTGSPQTAGSVGAPRGWREGPRLGWVSLARAGEDCPPVGAGGGWVGAKGSHAAGAHPGVEAAETTFSRAGPFAAGLGRGSAASGVGDAMAGTCLLSG